ncbi:MAG: pilus assembly protein PilM, partial [Spirochaetia bacterium]|nr:pilus assembly protein PilM [Spirochaetia bacterium]
MRLESLPIVALKMEAPDESAPESEPIGEYEYNLIRFVQSFFPDEQNFILNLTLDRVYIRDIVVPVTNVKQINDVIPFEVENLVPVSLDEAEVLGQAWDVGEENSRVITFTARHENLLSAVQPLTRGTGSLKMVSLDSVGLASAVRLLDPLEYKDKTIGQIDIGGDHTILNVIRDGKLIYSRMIPLGGHTITRVVAETLETDLPTAESKKLALELDVNENSRRPEKPENFFKRNRIEKKDYAKIIKRTQEVYSDIAEEIVRSAISLPADAPESYFISGGGSLLSGTAEFLADKLESRVSEYPLHMSSGGNVAMWVTAIGTGEHYREKAANRIDFLSGPFGGTLRRSEFNFNIFATPVLFAAASVIILLVSFLISILLDRRQIKTYREQVMQLATKIPDLRPDTANPVADAERICRDRLSAVQSQTGGVRVLEILKDLTDRTPAKTDLSFQLKRFSFLGKEVQFDAEVDNYAQ